MSVFFPVFLGKRVGDLTRISHLLGIPYFRPEHRPPDGPHFWVQVAKGNRNCLNPEPIHLPLLHEFFYVGSGPRMHGPLYTYWFFFSA